jgi:transposase-like protein
VDLWGRLSNPPDTLQALTGQGVERAREPHDEPPKPSICPPTATESAVPEVPGRLSNPAPATDTPTSKSPGQVQRRLTPGDINDICATYINGKTITELASFYGVNRTTIMKQLQNQGVPRRRVARKMTDALVAEAAAEYLDGHSLAIVANKFNVAIRTLRREFRKAGIATRPRQGWTY